ncbi:acyl-CoA dehydrogenase family protein [Marivirga sp. S37H4]|uniref:Acyl-CoA dehydrogenase family protein n=1 Tax=Marivirga aurantiaca TaxID=2802615 RepID=A0A934WZL2_9BACT|nr:acyl-CoA dehydrogenase family protein [Marivirga aurantiaca]MBK6266129.1 acyl-CoA dehydrogenase family protein [Marivirga aurantiaca]
MNIQESTKLQVGGAFLINPAPDDIFITSDFTEEQNMMVASAKHFVEQEVQPMADELENQKDPSRSIALLEKSGALGLLGLGVSEKYGGIDVSFNTTLRVVEEMAQASEFAPTFGVQTSIGIAPILFYGNDAQKQQYLPKLVSSEWKCCYCLTEPDAGSDANSGKTKATPIAGENAYLLTGQKMWITNAGIANIFIVFAKVEDDKNLSAFIVEKDFGGITLGEEERKMGIKSSSTRQVFFNEVRVPAENMLGERGEGFKIALNVLNTGRIKLGLGAVGMSKKAFNLSVQYAISRKQFGSSISSFGAIQHKLAQMAVKIYALEAAAYRTGHMIDEKAIALESEGMEAEKAKPAAVSAYGIECAIIKVFGSETQDFAVDEGVQIFGGMGFSEEAPMARLYRDARISRIFEGTNEINRMLIVDMLLKKAMNGELDLMTAASKVQAELTAIPDSSESKPTDELEKAFTVLENLKKITLIIAGSAAQKLMMKLKEEQEILMNVADMLIQLYVLESVLVKSRKISNTLGEKAAANQIEISKLFMHEATEKIRQAGQEALWSFAEGDELKMLLLALKRFTKLEPFNTKDARRRIAQSIIEEGKYKF